MFQTNNPNIYACGDCATPYKFTHAAEFQARMAVRNMFLADTNKLSDLLIPWCTYTGTYVVYIIFGVKFQCSLYQICTWSHLISFSIFLILFSNMFL